VIGGEGAGRVVATGAGAPFTIGARVAYLSGGGGYAEKIVVPASRAVLLPKGVAAEIAAASFLKGLTAEMLLRQVYPVRKGARALVYAAAGGVGTILTQWAVHLGVEAIAVVGDEEKARLARSLGAREAIIRTKTASISGRVRELTGGKGVEVVYDSVGAATFQDSLDSLSPKGMMVSYGNASGAVPPFAPMELAQRGSLFLTRPSLFAYATAEALPGMAAALFQVIESGAVKVAPPIILPLAEAREAHRRLESGRTTGSLVLRP
jgi:NADPH2:quinone reductase